VSGSGRSAARLAAELETLRGQLAAAAGEAEGLRLGARTQEARRFEGLAALVSGIAHDFNNLLTPILGEASLVLLDLPEGSPLRLRVERIRAAAQRGAALTAEMVHCAGGGSYDLRRLDLSRLVGGARVQLEGTAAGRVELSLELATGLPQVEGDPGRLARVVRNLVENAAEASDAGGRVVVRTAASRLDHAALARSFFGPPLPEGEYARVEVEDWGAGMGVEARARLFDPFFSTKFTGRGLGLAAVLGIVRAHRGAIEVETRPGRGTRVAVLLPAAGIVYRTTPPWSSITS